MISDNYIFRACPERTKAMTGTVRAVHKRREGAAGVSSHEAAPNARPGAALLNRRLGRDGFPSVSGAMSARARPAKLGGTTESWRLRPMGRGRHVFLRFIKEVRTPYENAMGIMEYLNTVKQKR